MEVDEVKNENITNQDVAVNTDVCNAGDAVATNKVTAENENLEENSTSISNAEDQEFKAEKTEDASVSDDIQSKSSKSSINFPSILTSSLKSLKSFTKLPSLESVSLTNNEPGNNTSTVNIDETSDLIAAKNSHEMKVERKNLLNMAKLSIKGLIESSLAAGHTLDSDDQRLEQFFILIEYVLRQGLRTPKNFFLQNKYFWPPLEAIEKLCPEACEITNSVRSLPGVKTHLGRGRAWIRLAVMQKKLADYFKVLVENRQVFSEWYDEGALVMSEEGVVLLGHLVGLNCIDANLCMKGDDLDNQVTVIDYSLYMKDSNRYLNQSENEEQNKESALQKLLDQKNYLEERNRHLETVTGELQKKTDVLTVSNQQLATELQALKIQIAMLKEDKDRVIVEKQHLAADHQKNLEDREKDLDSERETLRQSKADMDEMYAQIQQQLKQESNARTDLEKELEVEKSIKDELEMAMKLLEKDIYVKQDGLITLREQLDKVKSINVDIYQKLQVKTELEEKKNKTIEKLQKETEAFSSQIKQLQAEVSSEQDKAEKNKINLSYI